MLLLPALCAALLPWTQAHVVLQNSQQPLRLPESLGLLQTTVMVEAAHDFLNLLDADSRAEIVFDYEAPSRAVPAYFEKQGPKPPKWPSDFRFVGEQYGQSVWSNFPVSDVPRPGVPMGNLTAAQRSAAMDLLRVALSEPGFSKINDIMGGDQALADQGQPFAVGRDTYTLAFFGEPSVTDIWQLQFGGHHLALNLAVYRDGSVLSPVLTGAQPASYEENGVAKRALAAENDRAYDLLHRLTEEQRNRTIFEHRVTDLMLGPGEDGVELDPVGIQASELGQGEQELLFKLIELWAGMLNTVHGAARLEELRLGLGETYFAWAGPETHEEGRNGESYYRIQGPDLYIEWSPQWPGGDLTMHVHTIYRDPKRAYGRTLVADHEARMKSL